MKVKDLKKWLEKPWINDEDVLTNNRFDPHEIIIIPREEMVRRLSWYCYIMPDAIYKSKDVVIKPLK